MIKADLYNMNNGIAITIAKFDSASELKKDIRNWRFILAEIVKIAFSGRAFTIVVNSSSMYDSDLTFNHSHYEFMVAGKKYVGINVESASEIFLGNQLGLESDFHLSQLWIIGSQCNTVDTAIKIIEKKKLPFDDAQWLNGNDEFMLCEGGILDGLILIWNAAPESAETLKEKLLSRGKDMKWSLDITILNQKMRDKPGKDILPISSDWSNRVLRWIADKISAETLMLIIDNPILIQLIQIVLVILAVPFLLIGFGLMLWIFIMISRLIS